MNLERNRVFREAISKLTLLWKDKGDLIEWKGQSIKVEGVYKVDRVEKYGEYARAMELLGIHQNDTARSSGNLKKLIRQENI